MVIGCLAGFLCGNAFCPSGNLSESIFVLFHFIRLVIIVKENISLSLFSCFSHSVAFVFEI